MTMSVLRTPYLTRGRILLAFGVALAADGIQILLGPLGWAFFDEIIDVITMLVTTLAIGFHPLLLPTFLIEVVPIVDMFPTWTACVATVVALRRRQQRVSSTPPHREPTPPNVIDV
jgi:hypothetical protein